MVDAVFDNLSPESKEELFGFGQAGEDHIEAWLHRFAPALEIERVRDRRLQLLGIDFILTHRERVQPGRYGRISARKSVELKTDRYPNRRVFCEIRFDLHRGSDIQWGWALHSTAQEVWYFYAFWGEMLRLDPTRVRCLVRRKLEDGFEMTKCNTTPKLANGSEWGVARGLLLDRNDLEAAGCVIGTHEVGVITDPERWGILKARPEWTEPTNGKD